jgi:N-acetylglucosaminylphosphatidylinositol deacetylase
LVFLFSEAALFYLSCYAVLVLNHSSAEGCLGDRRMRMLCYGNLTKSFLDEKKILLVIAHPDDEALFFAPLLLATRNSSCSLSILCLSNGEASLE